MWKGPQAVLRGTRTGRTLGVLESTFISGGPLLEVLVNFGVGEILEDLEVAASRRDEGEGGGARGRGEGNGHDQRLHGIRHGEREGRRFAEGQVRANSTSWGARGEGNGLAEQRPE